MLQVPVPALEVPVRARYRRDDPSLLAADAAHVHAHVTVLGPAPATLSAQQHREVAALCRATPRFSSLFSAVDVFPDGIIYVPPENRTPWLALTNAATRIFPDHPPYGGKHPTSPHVTIDAVGPGVTLEAVRQELAPMLPVEFTADRLELVWYRSYEVRVLDEWPLA